MAKVELALGCDPEVFVVDKKGNFVSAHGLIGGTKKEPLLVEDGMVQVDGMALEFGVAPCYTEDQFLKRVKSVYRQLEAMLPKGLSLRLEPVAVFSQKVMDKQPPEALELGCDPDFNGYTSRLNPIPILYNPNMRSAGGHIHFGWGKFDRLRAEHILACSALAVELDYYLGVPSIAWDNNTMRRNIYGAPGAFRPKPYGMEYRTLSNQWLRSDDTIRFVYRQSVAAFNEIMKHPIGQSIVPYGDWPHYTSQQIIRSSIQSSALEMLRKIQKKEGLKVV